MTPYFSKALCSAIQLRLAVHRALEHDKSPDQRELRKLVRAAESASGKLSPIDACAYLDWVSPFFAAPLGEQ